MSYRLFEKSMQWELTIIKDLKEKRILLMSIRMRIAGQ